jgi:hypothetical protein
MAVNKKVRIFKEVNIPSENVLITMATPIDYSDKFSKPS